MIYLLPLFCLMRLCQSQGAGEANYVMNIESTLEACDAASGAVVDTSETDVDQYNESISKMSGYIRFYKDITCDVMIELTLEKEDSGQRQVMFSHEIYDLVKEILKESESDYHFILKFIDLPPECPFKAGKYKIKDLIVCADDLPLSSNTCGKYYAYLKFYYVPNKEVKEDKELMCCLTMSVMVEMV